LAGRPEARIGARSSPTVLLTWLHADEELAPRVAHHIYTQRPDLAKHIDYICGNPRAAANVPAVGFCETDLNRSFTIDHEPTSYEEKQAVKIVDLTKQYDYVLDLHTAVSPDMGDSVWVSPRMLDQPAVRTLLAATPNRRVLVMQGQAMDTSLIGTITNGITLEYSNNAVERRGIPDAMATLERLVGIASQSPKEREVFFIEGTIPKSQDPGPEARNFEFWPAGGYYPVLLGVGPRSYREDPTKDYCCFYAKRKETLII
jgi:hypothetical protein